MYKYLSIFFAAALLAIAFVYVLFWKQSSNFDWVSTEIYINERDAIKISKANYEFCYAGPESIPGAEANARYSKYWKDPFFSDLFIDSSSWTLISLNRSVGLVSFTVMQVRSKMAFPDEVVCGSEIILRRSGSQWSVQAYQPVDGG